MMWVWLTGQAGPEEASATAHGVSREVYWHVHGRALGAVGRRAEQPWGNPVSVSPRQEGRNGASEGIILEERHGLPEFSLPRAGCFCFLLLPILEVLFRSSTLLFHVRPHACIVVLPTIGGTTQEGRRITEEDGRTSGGVGKGRCPNTDVRVATEERPIAFETHSFQGPLCNALNSILPKASSPVLSHLSRLVSRLSRPSSPSPWCFVRSAETQQQLQLHPALLQETCLALGAGVRAVGVSASLCQQQLKLTQRLPRLLPLLLR